MDNRLQNALKKANAEVDNAGITDPELKKIAFSKAIDFYLLGTTTKFQPDLWRRNSDDSQKNFDDSWKRFEDSTGIETDKLKDVYSIKGKQVVLVISSVPGKSKADKQRNLAALILFSYQEALEYEWTPSILLAEAARHSKLYDTSKFAKNLKFDWFRAEGEKKGLKYKLSGSGINHAKGLLSELTKTN